MADQQSFIGKIHGDITNKDDLRAILMGFLYKLGKSEKKKKAAEAFYV